MKKIILFGILFVFLMSSLGTAEDYCSLNATLLNQDPFPAMPGEKIDLVFQVSGVDNFNCQGANFELILEPPFSLSEGETNKKRLAGPTWTKDNKKVWNIPYELDIDEDAKEGWKKIEAKYSKGAGGESYFSKDLEVKVEDVRVDFEVDVRDYDPTTKEVTLEILNIGEHDVEALTAEIENVEDIDLYVQPRKVIGSLYSNEETTFTFRVEPLENKFELKILYNDEINERRSINKTVTFNPEYYKEVESGGYSLSFYLLIILILAIVAYWLWKRKTRKKKVSE